VVHVPLTLHCFEQTASMRIFQDDVRRLLRRAISYVRCVVGFSLAFAGLWGFYGTFSAWGLPISFASIIAGGPIVPGATPGLAARRLCLTFSGAPHGRLNRHHCAP
jgi:hypothetical protein